jgi:hypothetical protein
MAIAPMIQNFMPVYLIFHLTFHASHKPFGYGERPLVILKFRYERAVDDQLPLVEPVPLIIEEIEDGLFQCQSDRQEDIKA